MRRELSNARMTPEREHIGAGDSDRGRWVPTMRSESTLKAGDWVECGAGMRSSTLSTASLPGEHAFMPEMLQFSGQRFRVFKRAHRTCDTVDYIGGRHLKRTVHLEGLRCSGQCHGDCQAFCLLFWKEAGSRSWAAGGSRRDGRSSRTSDERRLHRERRGARNAQARRAGRLRRAHVRVPGHPTPRRDRVAPLVRSLAVLRGSRVGARPPRTDAGAVRLDAFAFVVGGRYGLGTPLMWLYDAVQKLIGGTPYPERRGRIPKGGKTPSRRLDLRAGELVRVRELKEILDTIGRGLAEQRHGWHSEMCSSRENLPSGPSHRKDHQREDG